MNTSIKFSDNESNGFIINLGPRDNGQIILSNVTGFEMDLLGEPQLCEGTYFNIKKRNKIIFENIEYILNL